MGTLADEHAGRIFALQKAFAHLTKLDVHDNYLGNEGKTVLKKTKQPFHFGEQRDDDGPTSASHPPTSDQAIWSYQSFASLSSSARSITTHSLARPWLVAASSVVQNVTSRSQLRQCRV